VYFASCVLAVCLRASVWCRLTVSRKCVILVPSCRNNFLRLLAMLPLVATSRQSANVVSGQIIFEVEKYLSVSKQMF